MKGYQVDSKRMIRGSLLVLFVAVVVFGGITVRTEARPSIDACTAAMINYGHASYLYNTWCPGYPQNGGWDFCADLSDAVNNAYHAMNNACSIGQQ